MIGPRRRVATAALLAGGLIGFVLVAGTIWLLTSDTAVRWAAGEVTSRSGGKLALDGVTGSLGGPMHIAHLRYADADFALTGDDIAISWSPRSLLSRAVIINALSATHIEVTAKPGSGGSLPTSLALPWPIQIERADIVAIDINSGPNRWRVSQVAFRYSGGRERHQLDDLALDSEWGALRGKLTVASNRPFAVDGNIAFTGSTQLKRAQLNLSIGGDLARLSVTGDAVAIEARASGNASIAPFDANWLRGAEIRVFGLDLARFDAALPSTSLTGAIDRIVEDNGRLRGRIAVDNASPGRWSDRKVPIVALSSAWTLERGSIELGGIDATLTQDGHASGDARFGADIVQWNLALRAIDLHSIVTELKPTHLAGAVTGRLDFAAGEPSGEASGRLEQANVSVAFDAAVHEGKIDLRRFVARAHGGTLEGTAALTLKGQRAFAMHAHATALDPSQFGDYPAASLSGTLEASGALEPQWSSAIAFKLAESSRFRGLALAGQGNLALSPSRVHDAKLDLVLGDNRLGLSGAFGAVGDQMAFVLDAGNLAPIDARVGGRLRASGHAGGTLERPTLAFDGSGEALRFGKDYAAATLIASGEIGGGSAPGDRQLRLKVDATALRVETLLLRTAHADVDGTLGAHRASIAVAGGDSRTAFDLNARVEGGWSGTINGGGWSGKVVSLEGHGAYPFALAEPAQLDASKQRIQLTGARGTLAGGHFAIDELHWQQGRLASRGEFTGLPATPLLELAGAGTRLTSTLTLAGHWSIAATPRLNGTLVISREGGDLAPRDSPQLVLGLTTADLTADFVDDAVRATLTARSRYANVDVAADLAATARVGGAFGEGAPLQLSAHMDIASLRELQALAGTTALIDGQLKADLAGHGTLEHVQLAGTINGDALKLEAPQYGIYLKDGRLRATLTEQAVTVGEFSFAAGDGRFVASGTLPAAGEGDVAGTRLTWKADKLALFNRPDTRLTLSGSGTLALKNKTVVLAGAIKADEGYFEFQPSRAAVLDDDVVVRGRNPGTGADGRPGRVGAQRIPFAVDLTLDFGEHLRFVGEGFNTGLTGKLAVQTTADQQLIANGTIRATEGTYTAFGQVLSIQRGQLYFSGPLDNPGLDVFAVRKNLAVEPGVEVTGSVRVPNVQLTSNPPVPDNEKLAWLVLGHGLDSATGADSAVLQAALSALGGQNGAPIGQRIARNFGIDDISFRTTDTSSTLTSSGTGAGSQVIAFSKRLTDKLSLVYEQGLSVANNALKIEYVLSRNVTIRAEAGVVSGIGIYYSKSYR